MNTALEELTNKCEWKACRFNTFGNCLNQACRRECLQVLLLVLPDPEDWEKTARNRKEILTELEQ